MAVDLTGIVDWLKGWFYDKSEVNTYLNAKANKNLTNANMNVVTDASGNITTEAKPAPHPDSHPSTMITESSALSYIETNANASQHTINDAIDTMIGHLQDDISDLQGIEFIKVVSDKGTASLETMNKLYVVSENNKVNVYYTKRSGTAPNYTYAWQKMDTDILDELSLSWSNITGKPFSSIDSSIANTSNPVKNSAIYNALLNKQSKFRILNSSANDPYTGTKQGDMITADATGNASFRNYLTIAKQDAPTTINDFWKFPSSAKVDEVVEFAVNASLDNVDWFVTSIALVPKSSDNTGAIRVYYGDEPS